MFVIVRKGTFKSHIVVLLDIFKPYVFTFEHRRLFETRTSPVLYCRSSVELSTAALRRWSQALFFQLMILPFIFQIFKLTCLCFLFLPIIPVSSCFWRAMFCLSLYIKCPLYVKNCLACGSQLWVFKVLFSCQNFLISLHIQYISQLTDPNPDSFKWVWAKGLQPKTAV